MTGLFFQIDTRNHTATFLNGGHLYPYLVRRDGSASFVKIPGAIFGTKAAEKLETITLKIEPGDRCFMVTDGLLESLPTATGSKENPFDLLGNLFVKLCHKKAQKAQKLLKMTDLPSTDGDVLAGHASLSLKQVCEAFFANHPLYLSGGRQEDDCTLVIFERKET